MPLCSSCDAMKKENAQLRRALMDTNKQYVDVCNEVLALKRELEETRSITFPVKTSTPIKLKAPESAFYGMPLCKHKIQFDCEQCKTGTYYDPPPVPLVADPALVTYPKIWGSPKDLVEEFDELCLTRWERFVRSLKQEKDKWK